MDLARKNNATSNPIGDLIPKILAETTKKHQALHQLQEQWARLVGKTLADHTKPVSIRRGIVYVHADQPGASYTLSLKKTTLLKRVEAAAGCPVSDLVVRAGTL